MSKGTFLILLTLLSCFVLFRICKLVAVFYSPPSVSMESGSLSRRKDSLDQVLFRLHKTTESRSFDPYEELLSIKSNLQLNSVCLKSLESTKENVYSIQLSSSFFESLKLIKELEKREYSLIKNYSIEREANGVKTSIEFIKL